MLFLQEARCLEELLLQGYERRRVELYYQHVGDICSAAAADKAEEADAVLQAVSVQVANVVAGCTVQYKQQLAQHAQLSAESALLESCAQQYAKWHEHAVAAFRSLLQ
jgi:hypothetical protein